MMMKNVLLMLFTCMCGYSQISIEKDTLQLTEIAVRAAEKTKILKLEGPCSYPENMDEATEIITLVEKLPQGKFNSITFYFNKVDTATYKSSSKYFKDADFEVVLYDVNDRGEPGILSSVEHKILAVDKNRSGRVTVSLLAFDIDTHKKMFIGLRRVSDGGSKEFFVDCLCGGQDKYFTYARSGKSSPWERRWSCAALRVDVSVAVSSGK